MLDYLLNANELAKLKLQHKACSKKRIADRVKAVYLLGSGWSMSDVCEALLLSDDAVRSYFIRYKEKGLDGLIDHKYIGRQSMLTDDEKKLLALHLEEHTYSKVSEIIDYVEHEFEAYYTESGMRNVLKELNFVYKKPEKVPYRVDLVAQNKFIEKYKKLKKSLNKGDSIYFMDATHPEHTPVPAHGWIKKGVTKIVKSNPRPYRLNINGAINISSLDMVVRFEKKIDKETVKDFLEIMRKKQPKGMIYLICDNAGYYSSPEVQALAKAMAIDLIYLPPYSPNLNLIERVWKFFKKNILYNRYYENFSQMVAASRGFFRGIGRYKNDLRSLMTEKFQQLAI